MNKLYARIVSGLVRDKILRRKVRSVLLGEECAPASVNASVADDFIHVNGIIDFGEGFKPYFLRNNMPDKISILKRGLDKRSQENLDLYLQRMLTIPDNRQLQKHYKVSRKYWEEILHTEEEKKLKKKHSSLHDEYQANFWLPGDPPLYVPVVFLFHHGLRFASQKLKNYIAGKDFIDGGAYIGDSTIMLAKLYDPKKVYAFEISRINQESFLNVMKNNCIPENKFELVLSGLSDAKKTMRVQDAGTFGVSAATHGDTKIELTPLDFFTKERELNVGFIKADLEGAGYDALKGMLETIKKDKPVLSLSIYHTPEEFFEMKPLLEEAVKELNYKITIQRFCAWLDYLAEITLFAYPRELE